MSRIYDRLYDLLHFETEWERWRDEAGRFEYLRKCYTTAQDMRRDEDTATAYGQLIDYVDSVAERHRIPRQGAIFCLTAYRLNGRTCPEELHLEDVPEELKNYLLRYLFDTHGETATPAERARELFESFGALHR